MGALHVACAADDAYIPHTAAMLHSVLTRGGADEVHVHFLHGPEVSRRSLRRLARMVERLGGELSVLEIPDEQVAGLPTMDFISSPMWYRIFLPERLPELDRILYLDADTIVADSLEPLRTTDLSGHYVAAVTNVFEPHYLERPAALGLSGPEVYFNSGVVLMNLAEMRRDGCSAALHDFALAHRHEVLWPDQDALNVVLGGRRLALHPRWNCMTSLFLFPWSADVFGARAVAEALERPGIRHFEGPGLSKPWHLLCDRQMRELYVEHRRQTPWPRVRRAGVTPRNLVTRAARALHPR